MASKQAKHFVAQQLAIIKYTDPILIDILNKNEIPERTLKASAGRAPDKGFPVMPKIPGLVKETKGDRDVFYTLHDMRKMLHIMFPSKSYKEGGKLWQKHVSLSQASRWDLYAFEDELLAKNRLLSVNKFGISRMEAQLNFLYLDELVRQETLSCAERGLLVQTIRQELHSYVDLYEDVIASANNFFLRHSRVALKAIDELQEQLSKLEEQKHDLEQELDILEVVLNQSKRLAQVRMETDMKLYEDEMLCIKRSNQQLEMLLQCINPGHPVLASVKSIFLDISRI